MKPTLEQVRQVLAAMLDHADGGWIGEGEDIASELIDYIDGKLPDTPRQWARGLKDRAYLVNIHDPGARRGPFCSREAAERFLAAMPERAVSVSPIGSTDDRANYVVLGFDEFKEAQAAGRTL